MNNHFDICVIGSGMVGSAAAKYCATFSNKSIILIGPAEPKKNDYAKTDIFGAYYDEGRIVRSLYSDPLWAYLALSSVYRYRNIEQESGIKFYKENGFLTILDADDPNIEKICRIAESNNVNCQKLTSAVEIKTKFPCLNPLENSIGLYESKNAGSINPRLLVKAQQIIAKNKGVVILTDIVVKIDRNNPNRFRVTTKSNQIFECDKIILCVGAYLFHYDLLPKGKIDLAVKCGLISTARISVDENIVEKLSKMPSITLTTKKTYLPEPSDTKEAFYMMPPTKYPDGLWYLKLGYHSHARKGLYGNPDEITDWYRNGQLKTFAVRRKLTRIAQNFIPDLRKVDCDAVISDTCAIMETPNDRPYIDEINKNFYIVSGCNGFSAKSSDEFGRLVAKLCVNNVWDCPIAAEDFKCRYNGPNSRL